MELAINSTRTGGSNMAKLIDYQISANTCAFESCNGMNTQVPFFSY